MSNIASVQVNLTKEEYTQLKEKKGSMTWYQVLMSFLDE